MTTASRDVNAAQRHFLALLRDEIHVNQVHDAEKSATQVFVGVQRKHREIEELFFAQRARAAVRGK